MCPDVTELTDATLTNLKNNWTIQYSEYEENSSKSFLDAPSEVKEGFLSENLPLTFNGVLYKTENKTMTCLYVNSMVQTLQLISNKPYTSPEKLSSKWISIADKNYFSKDAAVVATIEPYTYSCGTSMYKATEPNSSITNRINNDPTNATSIINGAISSALQFSSPKDCPLIK